ncbi:MAG: hypothetical protein KAY32_07100 [Candidatus Eisenbacteria sp.]|nr:hypothetical protein [Candidatus Eisenbacteria bacterium]
MKKRNLPLDRIPHQGSSRGGVDTPSQQRHGGKWGAGCSVILAAVLVVALPPVLLANPLPEAGFMIHVQTPDPSSCTQWPASDCSQIVQYTEDQGLLEFDLFIYPVAYSDVEIYSAAIHLDWCPDWTLQEWTICGDYEGSVTLGAHQADLDLTWSDCPETAGGIFLVGRFVLDVTGHGVVEASLLDGNLVIGCPPNDMEIGWLVPGRAEAGVTCGYCYEPCDYGEPCTPVLTPGTVLLDVPQGETVQTEIEAYVFGHYGLEPCWNTIFEGTEDWMSLIVDEIGDQDYILTLTVDTSSLCQGDYHGWVRGVADCVDCSAVHLTVTERAQGIPEDDVPVWDADNPQDPVSWSGLKARYR